jgi:hypothetical protein
MNSGIDATFIFLVHVIYVYTEQQQAFDHHNVKRCMETGGVLHKTVHRMPWVITEKIRSFVDVFHVTIFMVWFSGLPEDMDLLSNLEQSLIKSGIGSCIAG